jgi:hypothetical protein
MILIKKSHVSSKKKKNYFMTFLYKKPEETKPTMKLCRGDGWVDRGQDNMYAMGNK